MFVMKTFSLKVVKTAAMPRPAQRYVVSELALHLTLGSFARSGLDQLSAPV